MISLRQQDSNFPVSSPRRSHTVISMNIHVIISNLFCTFLSLFAFLLIKEIQYMKKRAIPIQTGRTERAFKWNCLNGCAFIDVHRCECIFFQLYVYAEFSNVWKWWLRLEAHPLVLVQYEKGSNIYKMSWFRVCRDKMIIICTPNPSPQISLFSLVIDWLITEHKCQPEKLPPVIVFIKHKQFQEHAKSNSGVHTSVRYTITDLAATG